MLCGCCRCTCSYWKFIIQTDLSTGIFILCSGFYTVESTTSACNALVSFWALYAAAGTLWCKIFVKKPSHNFSRSAKRPLIRINPTLHLSAPCTMWLRMIFWCSVCFEVVVHTEIEFPSCLSPGICLLAFKRIRDQGSGLRSHIWLLLILGSFLSSHWPRGIPFSPFFSHHCSGGQNTVYWAK